MSNLKVLDRRELRPEPIGEASLPPKMLAKTKAVFDTIGPYLGMTPEQFDEWFTAESDLKTEVVAWCNITLAWLAYHEKFLADGRQSDDDERKLLIALIAISTGVKDVTKLKVPVEVGQRLLQCYDDVPKA